MLAGGNRQLVRLGGVIGVALDDGSHFLHRGSGLFEAGRLRLGTLVQVQIAT
jgi:hypothetical protein